MISSVFNIFIYQPLLNLTVFLYNIIPGKDLGMAIICLTILARILLYPLSLKALRSQRAISELEPKLKEIREKFKNDKEKITKETLALYQQAKVNPFSGILTLVIQVPILFGLYKVFYQGVFRGELNNLYSFVPNPGSIEPFFLKINLAEPNFLLVVLAVVFQWGQTKLQAPKTSQTSRKDAPDFQEIMRKQMLYFFPVLTFLILLKIPSAIALYLIVSSILSIFQTLYTSRDNIPIDGITSRQ